MFHITHFGKSVSKNEPFGATEDLKISQKFSRQSDFSAQVLLENFSLSSLPDLHILTTLSVQGKKEDDNKNNKNSFEDILCPH